jgi:hypothetical protein
MMKRFTVTVPEDPELIAIDLGYSTTAKSCGVAWSGHGIAMEYCFGACICAVAGHLRANGPCTLILEAVLSTYHNSEGNPSIRGPFEKGRGWYHGPGVSTYAAALRFLQELDRKLPSNLRPVPLIEGFLSYKPTKTTHSSDAERMLAEFPTAERFFPAAGSEPIINQIEGVPTILRFNPPPGER